MAWHWPCTQESSSARSTRLLVSDSHSSVSWVTRWWRCSMMRRACAQASVISWLKACVCSGGSVAWACSSADCRRVCASVDWASCVGRAMTTVCCSSPALWVASGGQPTGASDAGVPDDAAAAAGADEPSAAGALASAPSITSTVSSSALSVSQLVTSWPRRWCNRSAEFLLPSSTRLRLSFLRPVVHCRLPRSAPRTMRSIRLDQRCPSSAGVMPSGPSSGAGAVGGGLLGCPDSAS